MKILENISLKPYNTFGIENKAKYFVAASSIPELKEALQWAKNKGVEAIILGGGSNILLTKDQDALFIKIEIKGIELINDDEENFYIKVGAGEVWHDFVLQAIENNWSGIENLSLIPGTVGASPMQNIGAYGVEIKDVFQSLQAVNRETLEVEEFYAPACAFGYRQSVFKTTLKNKYVICTVVFKLNKTPLFNTEYGAIQETLTKNGISKPTIKQVSDAVISIRQSKLPDPAKIGNAGSFFKNPTISTEYYNQLQKSFPLIPGYPNYEGIKVPAAWLIEQCGWKGKRFDSIGVHSFQPLVLVNYGNGSGLKIKELAEEIQNSVIEKFNIQLDPEVNFL